MKGCMTRTLPSRFVMSGLDRNGTCSSWLSLILPPSASVYRFSVSTPDCHCNLELKRRESGCGIASDFALAFACIITASFKPSPCRVTEIKDTGKLHRQKMTRTQTHDDEANVACCWKTHSDLQTQVDSAAHPGNNLSDSDPSVLPRGTWLAMIPQRNVCPPLLSTWPWLGLGLASANRFVWGVENFSAGDR